MQNMEKYALQGNAVESTTIGAVKAAGGKVREYNGSRTSGVHMELGGQVYLASKAKTWSGEISDNTFIIMSANANGEPRLYLTNKAGIVLGKEV